MNRVSLDPSKRQAQLKMPQEKQQKPTLKPKPDIEAKKPTVPSAKVQLNKLTEDFCLITHTNNSSFKLQLGDGIVFSIIYVQK